MGRMDNLIEKTNAVLGAVHENTPNLRFSKDNRQHVYAVCLHGSVLEMASAAITLLKEKQSSAVPVILRNLLEAYVDLVNITKSPDYLKHVFAAYYHEQKRILKVAIDRGETNPYLEALANSDNLEVAYNLVAADLDALKDEGYDRLGVKERFDQADLMQLYESMYAYLCLHSHNNLTILERRHLMREGDDFRVAYFQPWGRDDVLRYVDTVGGLLVRSLKHIRELLGIEPDDKLSAAENALEDLRSGYSV